MTIREPRLVWMLLLALTLGVGARADSSVRIVRMSLMAGAVQINLPDGHGWRPALQDAPIVPGEQIRTLASGRAEIQFENGSTLRLIPSSEVMFSTLALSDRGVFETSAKLSAGTAFLSLRKADSKAFQLSLPSGPTLLPRGDATVRVDAGPGPALVTVLDGKADIEEDSRTLALRKGEQARLSTGQPAEVATAVPRPDPWTQWSQSRDQFYDNAVRRGIEPGGLDSYVNWYDGQPGVPAYTGAGLTYLGGAGCPWTVSSGDYAGWCWTEANGWFHPAQAPPRASALTASASDQPQTSSSLAASTTLPADPASLFYGGMVPCLGGMSGMYAGMYPGMYGGLYGGMYGAMPGGMYMPGLAYGMMPGSAIGCSSALFLQPWGPPWFGGENFQAVGAGIPVTGSRLGNPVRNPPGERLRPANGGGLVRPGSLMRAGNLRVENVRAGARLTPPPVFRRSDAMPASGLQASRTAFGRNLTSAGIMPGAPVGLIGATGTMSAGLSSGLASGPARAVAPMSSMSARSGGGSAAHGAPVAGHSGH